MGADQLAPAASRNDGVPEGEPDWLVELRATDPEHYASLAELRVRDPEMYAAAISGPPAGSGPTLDEQAEDLRRLEELAERWKQSPPVDTDEVLRRCGLGDKPGEISPWAAALIAAMRQWTEKERHVRLETNIARRRNELAALRVVTRVITRGVSVVPVRVLRRPRSPRRRPALRTSPARSPGRPAEDDPDPLADHGAAA